MTLGQLRNLKRRLPEMYMRVEQKVLNTQQMLDCFFELLATAHSENARLRLSIRPLLLTSTLPVSAASAIPKPKLPHNPKGKPR